MKCPVCEKEITNYENYVEHGILHEEYAKCEDENHIYGYEFRWGDSKERIGMVEIQYSWQYTKEEAEQYKKIYNMVAELEKERYQKAIVPRGT